MHGLIFQIMFEIGVEIIICIKSLGITLIRSKYDQGTDFRLTEVLFSDNFGGVRGTVGAVTIKWDLNPFNYTINEL